MLKSILVVITLGGLLSITTLSWNAVPEAPLSQADATFTGAASCKKCHVTQHETWSASKHSIAWDALTEQYHDPAQVDDSGRSCVSCHSTGYGHGDRGGFVDLATTPKMVGVQCEACHGAGSLHAEAGLELVMNRQKEFKEGEPTFITLTPTVCASCHNPHVSHEKYKQG